jgi:transposase
MLLCREDLPRDPDLLIEIVLDQAVQIERLQIMLNTVQALTYGARSERMAAVLENQLALDLGDLATDAVPPPANDTSPALAPPRSRKPAQRNIGGLPKHLERVERIIEPMTTDCPCCAGKLHRIGEDASEALDSVPAILRVIRTIRPKYACRACEGPIVQAAAKLRLFDGGMATTSLLVSIAVWKFAWYMPLSRQMDMLAGQGVKIDRSTACRWMGRLAWHLKGLYDLQLKTLHSYGRLFCDETRMPVRKPGQKTTQTCQFWSHAIDDRPWNGPAPPGVVYVFSQSRGHREIKAQLAHYQGLLQVDGYSGYTGLSKPGRSPGPIRLAFCMAHLRRKFTDIYKATPLAFPREVIERLAEIYAIEAEIRGQDAEHRRRARQERTAPLMARLKIFMEAALPQLSTTSKTAEAIRYGLNHWVGLTVFLEDGRVEIDNNTVERSMRPISLGRKNSLFAGSDGGAETWAILASLLNTAKLNDLDPYTYLNDVVERIVSGEVKNNQLGQLLAWNWKPAGKAVTQAVAA